MGKFTGVLNELKTRLTTAQGTGKKLVDVKTIYFGKRPNEFNNVEMPCLIVDITGFTERHAYMKGVSGSGLVSDLSVSLTIVCSITETADELTGQNVYDYYALSSGTGILHYIEKVLDVICETTSQAISPNLTMSSDHAVQFETNTMEVLGESVIYATINIKLVTPAYSFNTRNT